MKKLNENQKRFLGTVPKKYQLVETFWDCPEISKTRNNGITLIALIITIIVMLILVGVTINVALNGGLFGKAKDATFKTKISQIQEGLLVKKAEIVANNNGKEPEYNLTINDLDIANELKNEYGIKLKIGADGKLYYDSNVVTNTSEQNQLEAVGINEYVEPPAGYTYTFTLNSLGEPDNISDSILEYNNLDKIWEIIAKDLSKDPDYIINGGLFSVQASNSKFQDLMDIYLSNEIDENTEYIISVSIENNKFCIQVFDREMNNEVIDQESYPEFKEQYGDVVFTFKDVSGIKIPE